MILVKRYLYLVGAVLITAGLSACTHHPPHPMPMGPGFGFPGPGIPGPGMAAQEFFVPRMPGYAFAGPPMAAPTPPRPGMPPVPAAVDGPARMLPLLLRGVNLTADQHAKIRQIMDAHRATSRELMGQLRTAQEKLADKLFTSGGLQEKDLNPDAQQVSQLRNQLAEEDLKIMLEMRAVLTPEQLAKAAQLRRRMEAHRSEMGKTLGRPN